jgi:hypothetical protein
MRLEKIWNEWVKWYSSALWYKPSKVRFRFCVKVSTIQFYAIEHNFKSNCWIELKLYQKIPELFVYVGVYFQENPRSKRTCNRGPNRLYEFCYLLPFDLWTFYLAKILFLQGCGCLFRKFHSSTRIFNELQYNLHLWQWFINVSESFSYKDSIFILATQGKKGWWYLMTS